MKVLVCVKQVPEVTEIRFDPATRSIVREGVPAIVNPFDRPAIALAVDWKGRFGADTTVVTMGPPQAAEALFEALASGIDHAIHLCDRALAGSDTLATARALAALARREGPFDLILCGKYTVDGETAQVGPELAELLGLPHVAGVDQVTFSADGRVLLCERESDDGHERIEVGLPCLLTAAEGLMPPVGVRKPALLQARSLPIRTCTAQELGLASSEVGLAGSPTWVSEIRRLDPISRPPVTLLAGPLPEMARSLAGELRRLLLAGRAHVPPEVPPPRPAGASADRAVWVVVERTPQGELARGTRELLGKAAALGDRLGGEVVAVLVSGPPGPPESPDALADACAAAGADAVLAVEHPDLGTYSSEGHATAVALAIADYRGRRGQPRVVLFSSTERGRDFAPRVAARLGLGLTGDAIDLTIDEEDRLVALKPAFGGSIVAPILSRTTPAMATVRPGVFELLRPNQGRRARREVLRPLLLPPVRARLVDSEVTVHEGAALLGAARTVIGVGMGIGDPGNLPIVRELAEVLDGALCATRRVADKGWLPRQLQVGLTGKIIAPEVYIAVGVRGAPNHTIGIGRAGTIVAINADEKAPIFQLATYGVVAECTAFVPALTAALRGL